MKNSSSRTARNIVMKTSAILFISITLITLITVETKAAGCGFICGEGADTASTICSKLSMKVGTSFSATGGPVDCNGTPATCGMYYKSVCCCTPSDSMITPADGTAKSETKAPKFTMPQWQVPINTVELSSTTCVLKASGRYQCSVPWLGEYVTGIYNYGLSVAGILAAIILMAGGVLWLVSGGDASKVTRAKELIIGSITGLIILAGSYVLLTQVNPNLTSFNPISVGFVMDPEPISSEGNPNNSTNCLNCKVLSSPIPYKDGSMVNADLDAKLLIAYNNSAAGGITWRVTEAWPPAPGVAHNSTCHYNGMCVDVALTGKTTCAKVSQLITILQNSGLSVSNEYANCDGKPSDHYTGDHLHVK